MYIYIYHLGIQRGSSNNLKHGQVEIKEQEIPTKRWANKYLKGTEPLPTAALGEEEVVLKTDGNCVICGSRD